VDIVDARHFSLSEVYLTHVSPAVDMHPVAELVLACPTVCIKLFFAPLTHNLISYQFISFFFIRREEVYKRY
jgi:hypothetical protein